MSTAHAKKPPKGQRGAIKRFLNHTTTGLIQERTLRDLASVKIQLESGDAGKASASIGALTRALEELREVLNALLDGYFLIDSQVRIPWHLPEKRGDLSPSGRGYKRWCPTREELRQRIQAVEESVQLVRDIQAKQLTTSPFRDAAKATTSL